MTSDARRPATPTSKGLGDAAERQALAFLVARGLVPSNAIIGSCAAAPCRFDVVSVDGDRIEWLRAAFDARHDKVNRSAGGVSYHP